MRFTLMYLSLHICFSSAPGATVLFIFLAWVLRRLPFRQQQNHSTPLFYEVLSNSKISGLFVQWIWCECAYRTAFSPSPPGALMPSQLLSPWEGPRKQGLPDSGY